MTSLERIGCLSAMSKPRVTALVAVVAGVGFYLGHPGPLTLEAVATLAMLMLGTAGAAAGASAANQVLERRHDARMSRTCHRPIAAGTVSTRTGIVFATGATISGLAIQGLFVNSACALVTLTTLVLYLVVYTPLKRVTPKSTIVGAVPGALPPMIGWTAATGALDVEAWALFAILFVWQMPHFLSIAWIYRDDYATAGYPVLPAVQPDGARRAVWQIVAYSLVLIPVSLLPTALGVAGYHYYVGALVLGCAFLAFGFEMARLRSALSAHQHMLASLGYLTLLFALMSWDKVVS